MNKRFFPLALALLCVSLAGCSNILTYIRHDENKGNIQCNGEQGIKRDSSCDASIATPPK